MDSQIPQTDHGQALPAGTCIEEFIVERVLGSGGFGITYLARDTSLGRHVVINIFRVLALKHFLQFIEPFFLISFTFHVAH